MTPRETAIKRDTDAGGTGPPWLGRYQRVRCAECGYESRPLTAACELCGERLNEGN